MQELLVLPFKVKVRHLETPESYFARLKNANSIEFLTQTRLSASVLRVRAAIGKDERFATGTEALGQLPEGWFKNQRLSAVPRCQTEACSCTQLLGDTYFLCSLCAAGERVSQHPHVADYVCRQHNRWVGPGVDVQDQLTVMDYPSIRRADQTLAQLKRLPSFDLYQFMTLWRVIDNWAKIDEHMGRFPLDTHPGFDQDTHGDAAVFPATVAMMKRLLSGPFLTRLLHPTITRSGAVEILNGVLAPELGSPADSLAEELLIWLRPVYFRVAVATRKDPEGKRKTAFPIGQAWRHDLSLDAVDYPSWPQRRSGVPPGFPGFNSPESPMYIAPHYEHATNAGRSKFLRDLQSDLRMEFWWHSEGKPFENLRSGDNEQCSWICPDGHVTDSNCGTKVAVGRAVCAYCNGKTPVVGLNDLGTTDPGIAAFWHPTKNEPRDIRTVSVGSAFDAWWRCPDEGHEFTKAITDLKQYPGCPECRDPHRFRAAIDLRQKYPHFAEQWDPERNSTPEPPAELLEYYDLAWWICLNGHPFTSTVHDRQRRDGNCPACTSRRVLPGVTDIATVYPAIAAELHPTLNGELCAENLLPQSQKRVWWLCPNGHDYKCVLAVRTKLGIGCTKCTGRSIVEGETDFASVKPEVAARWHPTMNGELTPSDMHPGSANQAWFTCPCGKPYRTEIRMMRPDRYCREYTDYLRWHADARREGVGASL